MEALLAAVYLDGGAEEARRFVYTFILSNAPRAAREGSHDFKTLLQELVQRDGAESPLYRMTGESGPDHCKVFSAEVLVDGRALGEGSGRSKKEAEQNAARDALEKLKKS